MRRRRSYASSRKSSVRSSSSTVPVSGRQAEYNLANKVLRLQKITRSLKPEVKFSDVSISKTNVTLTGDSVQLAQIAQGLTLIGRVGNKVDIKSIYVAGFISTAATSFDLLGDYYWRCMVVFDKDAGNAVVSNVQTLVVDNAALPVNMLYQNTNLDRFKIMWDSGPMNITSVQGVNSTRWLGKTCIRKKIKCPANLRLLFAGPNAVDIDNRCLYFLIYTNANVATAASLDFTGSARCTFTDV